MPYEGLGARHTVEAATKAVRHGQIVEEDGFVGSAFKSDQVDRFVRPADAQDIDVGEMYEIQLGGIHEAPASGNLAAADVGTHVYLNTADNTLGTDAQGVTAGARTAGWLPVGIVTEVDPRTPDDVLRINANVAHILV